MNARTILALATSGAVLTSTAPTFAQDRDAGAPGLALTSAAFADGAPMSARYTCDGEGISPPLSWSSPPGDAKTIAIVVTDPDAPNRTMVHWIVFNVAAHTTGLTDGAASGNQLPPGAEEGSNGKGDIGWDPLCPSSGRHHYHFHVYALRDVLVLGHPGLAELTRAMSGQILAEDDIVGTYERGGK